MTDRKIMQQALDAILAARESELLHPKPFQNRYLDIIGKLEAALAQPEPPFQLTDDGADTNITRGLEPKGKGWVMFNQPNPEHQPWCDYLNIVLTSMPPQRANCNCKTAQPKQEPVAWIGKEGKLLSFKNVPMPENIPVYAVPPCKPWVGLTDADLMKEFGYTDELLRDTAYRVEQILAGRNT